MFSNILLLITFISIFTVISSLNSYNEKYRLQLHFSPPKGWMNDPNGLVHYKDTYHFFYQYYPNDTKWGPMHWGHATSKDLVHWQNLPIALYPQGKEFIFSGSAIIDFENVTGYQSKDNEIQTMVAIFTANNDQTHVQSQWMAYSTDEGLNWKFYANNPIIANPKVPDFRDPKVIKYNDMFVVVLVEGDHVQFYNSKDLKHWTLRSEFGKDQGSHIGVWECPDLFPIDVVIKGSLVEKWILMVNTGPTAQYYIGSFDGHTFKNENPKETVLWVDYGPDSYAGVTYNNAPDNRRIFISWFNRWEYANSLNFNVWNGAASFPREIKLVYSEPENKLLLSSLPVQEISKLYINSFVQKEVVLKPNISLKLNGLTKIQSKLLDIHLTVDVIAPKSRFGLEFKGGSDKLIVYFDGNLCTDRSKISNHNLDKKFTKNNCAPRLTTAAATPQMDLRVLLDVSSIELFADSGRTVMSSLFYSENDMTSEINLLYESPDNTSQLKVTDLKIHQLKGIWNS